MAKNDDLSKEIAAYKKQLGDLRKHHLGKFVLFKNEAFVGAFDDFEKALQHSLRTFGYEAVLIRRVNQDDDGAPTLSYAALNGTINYS